MLAITPGDVVSVDVDAAGLTLVCLPSATLGGLMLSRMVRSFLRISVCRYFLVVVAGTVPPMDLTRSAAALIMRYTSETAGVLQCAGYILTRAVVIPWVSHM